MWAYLYYSQINHVYYISSKVSKQEFFPLIVQRSTSLILNIYPYTYIFCREKVCLSFWTSVLLFLQRRVKNISKWTSHLAKESTTLSGGSRAAATSKMERFVIIVKGSKPLTIITKRSILDVAVALDSPPSFKKLISSSKNTNILELSAKGLVSRKLAPYNVIYIKYSEFE